MKEINRQNAFTLVELMTVIVIIGILSIIAIPSYRKYVVDSKISEAYTSMDAILKKELTYFNDHAEFFSIGPNPDLVIPVMVIESDSQWEEFGYPIALGTNVYFSYAAFAGKIDAAGTELATSSLSGNGFFLTSYAGIAGASTPSGACSRDDTTPADIGVTPQNGLDWIIVKANGDLDGTNDDEKCTALLRLIKTDPATNSGPSSTGYIVINRGS